MKIPETIGAWLRMHRALKNETAPASARVIGVSHRTYYLWEGESRRPTKAKHIASIARWAGASPSEVFELVLGE